MSCMRSQMFPLGFQELKPYVCRPALRVLLGAAARDLKKFAARELSRLMWAGASQSCDLAALHCLALVDEF